jgi:hypothetical protein
MGCVMLNVQRCRYLKTGIWHSRFTVNILKSSLF